MYPEYIEEIFEAWTKLCIRNLELLYQAVGDKAQAVFLCGTDFGTQHSEIMSKSMFGYTYSLDALGYCSLDVLFYCTLCM